VVSATIDQDGCWLVLVLNEEHRLLPNTLMFNAEPVYKPVAQFGWALGYLKLKQVFKDDVRALFMSTMTIHVCVLVVFSFAFCCHHQVVCVVVVCLLLCFVFVMSWVLFCVAL
jgi:hypothetical protein